MFVDKNFVLPETEKALSLIIKKIKCFFDICSVCFSGFYAICTLLSVFFVDKWLIPKIILSAITCIIFIISLLEFFKKNTFNRLIHLFFGSIKRIISILIFILVFINTFSSFDDFLPYKVLFTLFCGVGLIISLVGDIFNVTFPVWTKTVLDSFKTDIELSGLAARSIEQFKEELKKNDFKEKLTTSALYAGSSIVRNVFKKFFKNKDDNKENK